MSARKSTNKINLLPATEFATSTWGRILAWALSTFRVIVILTEMIVMLAFMSRFWLDAKTNDLNDIIKQKTGVVLSWKEFETQFKTTQKKLAIFTGVSQNSDMVSTIVTKVTSYLPNDATLTSFNYTPAQVIIKGSSASELSVAQLATNLASDKQTFSGVTIESMGTNGENTALLDFDLKLTLGKGGGK